MIESLESRRLLAVSVSVAAGVLTVDGDKDKNFISVRENAGNVHVETSTLPGGVITAADFVGITQIKINGGKNSDEIFYQGNTIGADIHGDVNNGGTGKNKDNITVTDEGTGSSVVDGDNGDDTIEIVVGNNTTVFGGGGKDNIYLNTGGGIYNTAAANTIVFGESGDDIITIYDGNNTVNGGDGNDTVLVLDGTPGANVFVSVETIS